MKKSILLLIIVLFIGSPDTFAQIDSNPKLILQITVDQLRGDMPRMVYDRLPEGGFKYFYGQGVVYENAHHRHANTETVVGHTTLATGADPSEHGMSTDYIGQTFGPGSLESEDNLIKLDRTLADLISFVDEKVGLDNVLLVLSADHGAPDVPGRLEKFGVDAGYFDINTVDTLAIRRVFKEKFNVTGKIVSGYFHPYVYIYSWTIA